MTTPAPQPWQRAISALLAFLVGLGPLGTPAYAALTDLADEPVAFVPQAPPNIVMTVDDSTSMLSDFLPDYVIRAVPNTAVPGFCRDATGAMNVACGFGGSAKSPEHIWQQNNIPFPTYADGNPPNDGGLYPLINYTASSAPGNATFYLWPAPVHSNALNRLYYDPSITYRPPTDAAGNPLPNQAVFTSVSADPWATEQKLIDLTTNVSVGMWCNTDWPLDTNWDPNTGGGNYCRINGTDYTQPFNVPQTKGDYQYPWSRLGAAPNDVKYFARSGGNKTIWCDTKSAKYPQTCNTTSYKCNTGTYIPPAKVPQTCQFQSNRMGCIPTQPNDYSPVGCNTDPGAGPPGPCTQGAECTPCACNNTSVVGKNAQCKATVVGQPNSNANCGCNGAGCALGACADYTPPGAGTCSDGSAVVPVQTCTPSSANCSASLVDPVTKAATGVTLYQDSQSPAGEVCRTNNRAYSDGTIASPFNYNASSAIYKTAVSGGANCGAVPDRVNRPRHYWKTSVEWCTNRIAATAGDKWRGFGQGADLGGTCQDDRDATYRYPRFYKYGVAKTDPAYADNYNFPAFERVDLIAANAPFVHTFQRAGVPVTITRTYLEEMTNYANWFAYYRTRIQAAKTVISQNFAFLDDQFRVGFQALSNFPAATWVNVAPFDAAQKAAWYGQLFGLQIPMGNDTPNMEAVVRIGELFKTGSSATLSGATDPIVLSCQRNFHMLFTDGIQNQLALPGILAGNRDDTISIPYDLPLATPPLMNGANWPDLYRENTAASLPNTLADYAMYYWAQDLRGMIDNVITGRDPAPWQHLNFAALSLGTEGTLNAKSTGATESLISAGTLKWPTPAPNSWQPTTGGVDDLWHAAVNGRGRFVNAKTSQELGRGIAAILRDLSSPKGTDSGAGFGNPNLGAANNYVYIGSFDGSLGTVKKVLINPLTAAPVANVWDAATELTTQLTPSAGFPDPWNTLRRVVTVNTAGVPVAFQPGSLSAAQLATLGPDLATQAGVIEYLRGNRALEGPSDGQLRERGPGQPTKALFGDVVNATPVAVGPPDWPYQDANDPGYSAFKAANATRPRRVYAAANDGMLHVIDDADGRESFAYIPRDLFRGSPNDKEGLVGLTYQEGGLPFYEHRYYVNATPRAVDVDFGGANWRTILVGGLGKGGQMYYALDVTDPGSVVDEATAASKVLWEFRNADLGFTYGKPVIVKTRAFGWVVIVPTGYNNTSGRGKIFVLRASDGTLLKTMDTGFGTPASPSGLAHIAGYVKDYRNQTVEQVYGGDLYGNVWRFDLSDAIDANWTTELLATLDSGGTPQPVTTPPQIEVDINNGVDRWVFIGTGRLLHVNDLASLQQQTMYALRDGTYDTPGVIGAPLTRGVLDLISTVGGLGQGVIATKGWYDDLPAGSRLITPPEAVAGVLGYAATGIAVDPCEAGQPAYVYIREFSSGFSANPAATEPDGSTYVAEGGAALDVVAVYQPGCTADCVPDLRLVVTTKGTSTVLPLKINLPGLLQQHRFSWRFLSG